MSETHEVSARREVAVTAWVPRTLAQQIQDLAEAGDRSISREAASALRAHVALANPVERDRDLSSYEAVEPDAADGGQEAA